MNTNQQFILVNQKNMDAYYDLIKHTTYQNIKCAVCFEEDGMVLLQGSNSKLKDYGFDFIEPAVYRKLVEKDKIFVTVQRTDYLNNEKSYFENSNNG